MPSSTYEVRIHKQPDCPYPVAAMFGVPLTLQTARWGDITSAAFGPPDAKHDVLDLPAAMNKLQGVTPFFPEPRTWLKQRDPAADTDAITVVDLSDVQDGILEKPYPSSRHMEFCPCADEALILADIDADGDIDEDDEALSETTPVYFVVNSDDDNGNDVEDHLDDGPVFGEDDLVEVALSAKCPPLDQYAWWKVSWTEDEQNPVLKVWRYPDKSNGQGGLGTPIENDDPQYDWPVPERVWIEAHPAIADVEILFRLTDNTVTSSRLARPPELERRLRASACHKFYQWVGYQGCAVHVPGTWCATGALLEQTTRIYSAGVDIQTRDAQLCGEPFANAPAHSAAWVAAGVMWPTADEGNGRWSQTGYFKYRPKKPKTSIPKRVVYFENKAGDGTALPDYDIAFRPNTTLQLGATHPYQVWENPAAIPPTWYASFDNEMWADFSHDFWGSHFADNLSYTAEGLNYEDHAPGTADQRTQFSSPFWWNEAFVQRDFDLNAPSARSYITSDHLMELNKVSGTVFEVWDKR